MFEPKKALVEYSATCHGFPVVFSIYAGNGEQVTAILKSLEVLENIQRSFIYASTDTPHVYFHLVHGNRRSRQDLQHEVSAYAAQRGSKCLSATGVLLYPGPAWTNNILWVLAVSGVTVKGLNSDSREQAITLIDEKVSAAKNNSHVYQAEINRQWKSSEIIPRGRG